MQHCQGWEFSQCSQLQWELCAPGADPASAVKSEGKYSCIVHFFPNLTLSAWLAAQHIGSCDRNCWGRNCFPAWICGVTEHSAPFWPENLQVVLLLREKFSEASLSWGRAASAGWVSRDVAPRIHFPGFLCGKQCLVRGLSLREGQRMCLGLCWVQGAPGDSGGDITGCVF